jgi:hypothetical protein
MDFKGDKNLQHDFLWRSKAVSTMLLRFYGMLKIPRDMIETLIGKIQQPFLAKFLPTLLLGVSDAIKAENSGG